MLRHPQLRLWSQGCERPPSSCNLWQKKIKKSIHIFSHEYPKTDGYTPDMSRKYEFISSARYCINDTIIDKVNEDIDEDIAKE